MPPRRPNRRTNTYRVKHRAMNVMFLTVKWQPRLVTLAQVREQIQAKALERVSR